MGGSQSSTASSLANQKLDELLFERGDDALSVEVHCAEHNEDQVTVFSYFSDSKHKSAVDDCIQAHKTLRHPSILKYLTVYHSNGGVHVVTEAATPLSLCVEYVTSWEVTVGLNRILQVLQFLHTQAGFSHNNVSVESVFITPDGEWKLGRLDCVRKFTDNSSQHLTSMKPLLADHNPVPEEAKQASLKTYCRDMKGFGHMCEALQEKLQDFGDQMTSNFSDCVDLMLSDTDSDIPPAVVVTSQPLLKNHLVNTLNFIEQITLKSPGEKQEFFSSLLDNLRELPEIVIAKMLVRPLLKRLFVEEKIARDHVLPKLLTPKTSHNDVEGLISTKLYKKYLPPVLYRLFTVKEYNIRLLLLQTFHSYCHLLDKTRLEKYIMPLILQGLHDRHDIIVSHTLMALSHLVPVLTGNIVIGTERRDTFTESSARAANTLPGGPQSAVSIQARSANNEEVSAREDNPTNSHIGDQATPKDKPKRERPPRKPRQPKPRQEAKPLKLGSKKKMTDSTGLPDTELVADVTSEDRLSSHDDENEDGTGDTGDALQQSSAADKAGNNVRQTNDEEGADFSDWDDFDDWDSSAAGNDNQSNVTAAEVTSKPDSQPSSPRHNITTSPVINSPRIDHHQSIGQSTVVGDSSKDIPIVSTQKTSGSMFLKSAMSKKVTSKSQTKKINDDFSKLDIKASTTPAKSSASREMDFFADMVPTIKSTEKAVTSSTDKSNAESAWDTDKKSSGVNLAFALQSADSDLKDGWGGEEDGWDW